MDHDLEIYEMHVVCFKVPLSNKIGLPLIKGHTLQSEIDVFPLRPD